MTGGGWTRNLRIMKHPLVEGLEPAHVLDETSPVVMALVSAIEKWAAEIELIRVQREESLSSVIVYLRRLDAERDGLIIAWEIMTGREWEGPSPDIAPHPRTG